MQLWIFYVVCTVVLEYRISRNETESSQKHLSFEIKFPCVKLYVSFPRRRNTGQKIFQRGTIFDESVWVVAVVIMSSSRRVI